MRRSCCNNEEEDRRHRGWFFFANAISFVAEQFEQLIDIIGRDATLFEDTNIELMDVSRIAFAVTFYNELKVPSMSL